MKASRTRSWRSSAAWASEPPGVGWCVGVRADSRAGRPGAQAAWIDWPGSGGRDALPHGLADDLRGRVGDVPRDGEPDRDVGPCGAGERHPRRGDEDGDVSDDVVSRADPGRAHVDVVLAPTPEKTEADEVREQREEPQQSHELDGGSQAVDH